MPWAWPVPLTTMLPEAVGTTLPLLAMSPVLLTVSTAVKSWKRVAADGASQEAVKKAGFRLVVAVTAALWPKAV